MNIARVMAAISIAALMTFSASMAADMDISSTAHAPNAMTAPKEIPIQQNQPNCSRWTDECVNCTSTADGAAPLCSNIGIACKPKAIRCISGDTPQSNPLK